MSSENKYLIDSIEVEFFTGNVMYIRYERKSKVQVRDAQQIQQLRLKRIGKVDFYVIMDMSLGLINVSMEAKAWMSVNTESLKNRVLDVVIVGSLWDKMRSNIYLTFFKPTVETKVVRTLEEAKAYVLKVKSRDFN